MADDYMCWSMRLYSGFLPFPFVLVSIDVDFLSMVLSAIDGQLT